MLVFVVDMGFGAPFGFGILALACGSLGFRPFDGKGGAFEFAIVPGGCVDCVCENAPVKRFKIRILLQEDKAKYHFADKTKVWNTSDQRLM